MSSLRERIEKLFRRRTAPSEPSGESIGIATVSDYLKCVGMELEISLRDSPYAFRGRLLDLTDDCSRLILAEVTEYDDSRIGSPAVAMQERILIPVSQIALVRIRDRTPQEDLSWLQGDGDEIAGSAD